MTFQAIKVLYSNCFQGEKMLIEITCILIDVCSFILRLVFVPVSKVSTIWASSCSRSFHNSKI